MKSAQIKLYRTSQPVSRGRDYEIYVDGKLKTTIANGGEKTIELSPGRHTVMAKIDWCKSQELKLNLEPGEEESLVCGSKLVGWKRWLTLFYLFSTNEFIYLERYSGEKELEYKKSSWGDFEEKGLVDYIFRIGVINWGIPVGVIMFLVEIIFNHNQYSSPGEVILSGVRLVGTFSVAGLGFGFLMWASAKLWS